MRYFWIDGTYTPKHCIYGPRPREAVFLSDWEWYGIAEHLLQSEKELESARRYSEKQQHKKETSFSMTKNWQNTLTSVKTQFQQRRIQKKEKEKQDKIDQYNEILRKRKEEAIPILANAKKILYETKDSTRSLNSAVVQCSVLAERDKQVEFHKFLREEEARRNALYAESIAQDAKYIEDEKREQIKKMERKKQLRRDLLKQIEDKRRRIAEAESREKKAAEEDLIKMREALERMEKCRALEKADAVKRARMKLEKSYYEAELEKHRAMEEDEENEVIGMIQKYAKRFEKERLRKEKCFIEEACKKRERMAEFLTARSKGAGDKGEEACEKAVMEAEEEHARAEKEREELRNTLEREMKKWEEENKARVAADNRARGELLKWTILQNERRKEIDRAWNEEKRRRVMETRANLRAGYEKQIKEKEESARCNRELEAAFDRGRESENSYALEYCDQALEYVKDRQWPSFPILSAVARVRKDCGTASQREKPAETEVQNKRPTRSFGYDCYCFKN